MVERWMDEDEDEDEEKEEELPPPDSTAHRAGRTHPPSTIHSPSASVR
jgi:hypothetical protein